MEMDEYHFANLGIHEELMQDLRNLEARMKEELGYEIALIAYTKELDGLPS
ncbi:hypothetical protein [Paenibacillus pectinilyticus]|uniref:hypothetical protein n=1 Tax=Paenibacillus pectinilyticus TaxID=512399 RepID=UPI0014288E05|nr:hypothetical protein [Paenibacillus pectinilyticus]